MKILIIGHKQHGKDTAASLISNLTGSQFESSSIAAARLFLYDALKKKYGYKTFLECYEDRDNHRAEWYNMIREYNKEDKARLAKEILKDSDIYVGMRDDEELQECNKQNLFDIVIGIFDPNKPLEDKSSFNIDFWGASHIVIPNTGTIEDLQYKLEKIINQ